MTERPLWRWWLWCFALWLYFRTGWEWACEWQGRLVLPEWLASPEDLAAVDDGDSESPF